VRLREDQIEFLKGLDDAAAVIRQLIDDCILKTGKPDVILIKREIDILQRRLNEIVNGNLYKACKFNIQRRNMVKDNPDIKRTTLMDIRTLQLIPSPIEVDTEAWKNMIGKSIDVFNAFQSECRKIVAEIEKLQAQLITTGK
jgi:hypothetical protein